MLVRCAFVLIVLVTLSPAAAAAADPLIGMAQITRSDGLKLFVLTGTYRDSRKCQKLMQDAINQVVIESPPPGLSARIDFMVCDAKPSAPEFAALRGEGKATHVIFFTESFRAMPVHPRNARDAERKACDFLRQRVLTRFGVNGECLPPGR